MNNEQPGTNSLLRKGIQMRAICILACVCVGLISARLVAADISPPFGVDTFAGYAGRGSKNGTGEAAMFNTPNGLAVDGAGVIYVADTDNSTIRRITSSGVVTTWAGVAGVDGVNNGPGTMARFNRPYGIAAKADGTLFVADTASNLIRQITPAGEVTTLAGSVGQTSLTNGTGTAASFNLPTGLAYDAANGGVLYIADTGNKVIRKIASGA
ncbi:MAG: hypothetical protein ABW223_09560, partial [Rariglobus sp.]